MIGLPLVGRPAERKALSVAISSPRMLALVFEIELPFQFIEIEDAHLYRKGSLGHQT